MNEDKIRRINELYHLEKSVGLSEKEKKEQKKLREKNIYSLSGQICAAS